MFSCVYDRTIITKQHNITSSSWVERITLVLSARKDRESREIMPMQWQNFLDVLGRKMRSSRLASDIALKTKINREDELMSYLVTDHEIMWVCSHRSAYPRGSRVARDQVACTRRSSLSLVGRSSLTSSNTAPHNKQSSRRSCPLYFLFRPSETSFPLTAFLISSSN